MLDAARADDLAQLNRLLGENPALANYADRVRGPSIAICPPHHQNIIPCCVLHASLLCQI